MLTKAPRLSPDPEPAAVEEANSILRLAKVSKQFGAREDFFSRLFVRTGMRKQAPMVQAVDHVDLAIKQGQVLGLVGESGCGKSTLGRIATGIMSPSSGEVLWRGREIRAMSTRERLEAKLRVQMVFQNPYGSLNPRMTVAEIVGEAPRVYGLVKDDADAYVDEQLRRAGLDPSLKGRYPHEFSGGQRQRIGIARALAVQPELLICDEAVSALDVSIQAQVLNLFMDLRDELNLTYLFISHDLGVVEHISDRVAIMYLGRIVEEASTDELFARPNHPYTKALLQEVPRIDTGKRTFATLKGELPSPLSPPKGCHFHTRCPHAMERCRIEPPPLRTIAPGHQSACHLNDAN